MISNNVNRFYSFLKENLFFFSFLTWISKGTFKHSIKPQSWVVPIFLHAKTSGPSEAAWKSGRAAAWISPPSVSVAWGASREAAAWGSGVRGASPRTSSSSSPSPEPWAARWTPPGTSWGQAWRFGSNPPLSPLPKMLLLLRSSRVWQMCCRSHCFQHPDGYVIEFPWFNPPVGHNCV